jgi:hypothetical protein
MCRRLNLLKHRGDITVVDCAAGDRVGTVVLHLYDNNDSLSSIGEPWNGRYKSTGEIPVRMVTLDSLAEKHGIPSFVKVDVEGFDDAVFRGMSFRPRIASFELNLSFPQVAERCLEAFSSGYEFNFIEGLKMSLVFPIWKNLKFMQSQMRNLLSTNVYGDVIARKIGG